MMAMIEVDGEPLAAPSEPMPLKPLVTFYL
jgi:hypothetical protein